MRKPLSVILTVPIGARPIAPLTISSIAGLRAGQLEAELDLPLIVERVADPQVARHQQPEATAGR